MRIILQRVLEASVCVAGEVAGAIKNGYLLLVGAEDSDTSEVVTKMADKICKLRICQDEAGKTNLSLADTGGQILVVSQFTLYADCRKGNRPSFTKAGSPILAEQLYQQLIARLQQQLKQVEQGQFGAEMQVHLVNDGPFTLILDSKELRME